MRIKAVRTTLTSSTITGLISSAEITCLVFSASTSEVGVSLGTKRLKINKIKKLTFF